MTLILTAALPDAIVQVSDRRLTRPDGKPHDDDATKAVCVECQNAHFSVGYTGIAFLEATRTDRWLAKLLAESEAGAKTLDKVAQTIATAAGSALARGAMSRTPRHLKRLTFVLAGFVNDRRFMFRVTNMEAEDGSVLDEARDGFGIDTRVWKEGKEGWVQRRTDLVVVGTEAALEETIGRRIRTFRKDSVRRPPPEVADMMVDLIRAAGRHGKYGKFIGRNCMSVIVPRNGGFRGIYHPDKAKAHEHYPHLVLPHMAIMDPQQESDSGDFDGIQFGWWEEDDGS